MAVADVGRDTHQLPTYAECRRSLDSAEKTRVCGLSVCVAPSVNALLVRCGLSSFRHRGGRVLSRVRPTLVSSTPCTRPLPLDMPMRGSGKVQSKPRKPVGHSIVNPSSKRCVHVCVCGGGERQDTSSQQ